MSLSWQRLAILTRMRIGKQFRKILLRRQHTLPAQATGNPDLNSDVTPDLIALLKRGIDDPVKLARALSITPAEVCEGIADLEARRIKPVLTPGQKLRAKSREKMAEMVHDGTSVSDVAKMFGKVPEVVRAACRMHGVEIPKAGNSGKQEPRTLPIIARLIESIADEIAANPNEKPGKVGRPAGAESAIAKEVGVSSQFVYAVKRRAEAAGIFAAVERVRNAKRASGETED